MPASRGETITTKSRTCRSKNGTHLNGQDVSSVQALHDGDEIQIALRYKLAFVDAGATAPLSSKGPDEVGLRLDSTSHQVYVNGKADRAAAVGAAVPAAWSWRPPDPGVIGRDEIVRAVWTDAVEGAVSDQSIDALVRRLRERLAEADPDHQYLVTMRGHGFRFENDGRDDDAGTAVGAGGREQMTVSGPVSASGWMRRSGPRSPGWSAAACWNACRIACG